MSPSRVDRRRLADDAVVDALAARGEPLDHLDGAVDRRAFLVGGEQQRDRAGRVGMRGDERLDRRDERGERALHVGGAAAVEPAVALGRARTGRECHCVERAGRHDVGVAGEADQRARASPRRAQRLVTPLETSVSQRKPSGARRAAISAWQPASSGVSERRAISSRASASVGRRRRVSMRAMVANGDAASCGGTATRGATRRRSRRAARLSAARSSMPGVDRQRREVAAVAAACASRRRCGSIASTRDVGAVLVDEPGEVGRRVGARSSPRRR